MSTPTADARVSPVSVAGLRAALDGDDPPMLIDVRKAKAFLEAPSMIAGALRRDAEQASIWGNSLPAGTAVVVYCVHGHEVSQGAARVLCEGGIAARYLEGGIEAWSAAGGALDREAARCLHPLDHARASEDRSHRVSVVDRPIHRLRGGISLRAGERSHLDGDRARGSAL